MGGLRFGDQILQINGENVAGWSKDKCMKVLKKASSDKIVFAIRDRYVVLSVSVAKRSECSKALQKMRAKSFTFFFTHGLLVCQWK